MPSLLPLYLVALLLLLHPGGHGSRVAPSPPSRPAAVPSQHAFLESTPRLTMLAASESLAQEVVRSPLFEEFVGTAPAPVAVADAPPPGQAEDQYLLAAVAAALPSLGGEARVTWGTPTAVGPVLRVSWRPGVALNSQDAIQQAVVAAVGTVVETMDREFPEGFQGSQGARLAAVQVDLPEQDGVLVAVRTYRGLVAGETSEMQFASQWRLLHGARSPSRVSPPAPASPRIVPIVVPERVPQGAPERWPPRIARFYEEVLDAARAYQIDPDLLAAIMQQESGGNPYATGAWAWIPHMGRYERAIGLMQVMPNEAQRRGVSPEDAWEPAANIMLGARVLRDKLTVIRGDFWTRVQGYYGFGDALSDYWLNRVYANWLAFQDDGPRR